MECPVVTTKYGKVQGRLCSKISSKQVFNYSKVPFAKPPVNNLRFQPPQDADSWDGILKCDVNNTAPIQDEKMGKDLKDFFVSMDEFKATEDVFSSGSEDCLYLDVYTACPNTDKKLPVLFWIYGGGFQMGSSGFYNGKVLVSLHDVVVVIPNYRLNAFGFFTTGKNSKYPGNMGMLDQVKALEWARDNVSAFGGNPNNITIHGESAGGISVGLHCLSPLSKGLFHKAISHSGVADFPMLVKEDYSSAVQALSKELQIMSEDPDEIAKQLMTIAPQKIIAALEKQNKDFANAFAPVVDGHFLPKNPKVMLQEKSFHKIPYVIGFNSDEGSGLMQQGNPNFKAGLTEDMFDEQLKMTMGMICFQKPEKVNEVMQTVKAAYSKDVDGNDPMKWSRVMGTIARDLAFTNSSLSTLNAHKEVNDEVYMYYMNQATMWLKDPSLFKPGTMKSEICDCDHGDDIYYTFGYPFFDQKFSNEGVTFTEAEKECSRLWMTYVTNFATSGNPSKGKAVPVEWPRYSAEKFYITINSKPECQKNFNPDHVKLWTQEIPKLLS